MAVSRRALLRGGLTVTAVGALGASVPIVAGASSAVDRPQMYGCDEWGARPPNGTIEVLDRTPTYIVVHHTAGGNSQDLSLEHAFEISRGIQNFHMDDRGWVDSGQQFTNSRGGHITEGRHRSLEILDGGTQHVMGAHVGNHNSETIGIENEGLYSSVDVTPELWDSLVQLVAYMAQQYSVTPDLIRGHRDFNATECPGEVLYGRLPELREAVGAVLGLRVTHPETWPLLRPGDRGAKVLAAQHLLRAQGALVEADGVFGPATFAAVQGMSVAYEPCYASRVADESGFVGAPTWERLVRTVRAGENSEAGRAARALLGDRGRSDRVIDLAEWRRLLG
ncbi:N-acetylmuramoyl-L-alanine amidase [Actinophytocola xinjiangensis]|uniref:N-acetylmuramoyl-L-alanine amidase n=1 Tax=Actinophytocola xinjiangensis TaxID=485602 RepID=A0A7Z0WJ52_9PSEU|nr:peptidoglycan recognition family protein [Actinophytocola xinjiangensis]OLF07814.1 N-acetylmuramoyl-L-alanine amidase [Actinophytocola xinjiangensis]